MSENILIKNVLMCGTGEYTTGYTENYLKAKDKKLGVIGLTLFDLKRRHFVQKLGLCGTNGYKFSKIKKHFEENIAHVYKDMDVRVDTWPEENIINKYAYKESINNFLKEKDAITIFTPDNTHYEIASYAIENKIHVLLAKPPVMNLKEHLQLLGLSVKNNVLVQIDFHKRWDHVYADAKEQISRYGDFSYFYSYMSQPKSQLKTFAKWLGNGSDISYYLNSHHIDFHCWAMKGTARPITVSAYASYGVALNEQNKNEDTKKIEDSITIVCQWENIHSKNIGVAVYTAAWIAPNNAEVHSQQRFTCLCHGGEVRVDQAHRGYEITTDNSYRSANPLYMKYTPDSEGFFAGQNSYGYLSVESFIRNCAALNSNKLRLSQLKQEIPTLENTIDVTAILEAARKSLDNNGMQINLADLSE